MATNEEYDLEALLELREKERREAEKCYARAIKRVDTCRETVRRRRQAVQTLIEKRKRESQSFDARMATQPPTIAEIRNFDHYLEGLADRQEEARQKVDEARRQLREAKQRAERANEKMLEAARQLEAVERHYEDWKQTRQRDKKRKAASEMDDVAARIWRQHQGG